MAPFLGLTTGRAEQASERVIELMVVIAGILATFTVIVLNFRAAAYRARTSEPDLQHVHSFVATRGSPTASIDKSKCPRCRHNHNRRRVGEASECGKHPLVPLQSPPYVHTPTTASMLITPPPPVSISQAAA